MSSASDNFNRADGGVGGNWTVQFPFPPFNAAQIVSNSVRPTVLGSIGSGIYNALFFNPDQYSQITIVNFSGVDESQAGVFLRSPSPTDTETFYLIRAYINTGAGVTTDVQKAVAATYTIIATEGSTTWVGNDVLRGICIRGNVYCHRNGSLLLTATDGAVTFGQPGWAVFTDVLGTLADAQIDDWNAADFTKLDYSRFPKPKIAQAALRGEM